MALRLQSGSEPIPGYRLIDQLGSGGFGEVWSAKAPDGRMAAIKIVHGDLAAAGDRTAEQELHGLERVKLLRHPFLLALHRIQVSDGQLIVVMELSDDGLWERFRVCRSHGKSGIRRADLLRYLGDAAEVLDHLRQANLQHLDVKPQNLLLVSDRCKVGDFGLVQNLGSGRPGAGASPAYSAPETFAGRISWASDQYSLAIVYQEMLTGVRPFTGSTPEQLAHQHLAGVPNLAPLPASDRLVVGRALAKKPDHRFPSCVEFIRALHEPTVFEPRAADFLAERKSAIFGPPSAIRPAVVIGIGGVGRRVLAKLRRTISDEVAPTDSCPLRLLYIDTDPDDIRAAVETGDLGPADVLPTRLQHADHYSKLRIDAKTSGPIPWCQPAWLDRLDANISARGCRGLGRLAFVDHFQALRQKLDADLTAVGRGSAERRSVTIIAGLTGGTGSGMAIDVAYLAGHLLRRSGDAATVSGWFLAPPVDADDRAVANAFAALTEVRHFSKPESTYRARCDDPPDSLKTRAAPFTDIVVLPIGTGGVAAAVDGLIRDLTSPAPDITPEPGECRTFGHARSVWPRRAILARAAKELVGKLVEQWTTADVKAVAAPVNSWVTVQWKALELGPEALSKRVQEAATVALGRPIQTTFASIVGPADLVRREAVDAIRTRLDDLIDRLGQDMAAQSDGLVRDWGTRLGRLAATLLEQPGFRLAGGEAAVRLLIERIERALTHARSASAEMTRRADAARSVAGDPAAAARWRYQALIMRTVAFVYNALRGQLADQLTEIGVCRARLTKVVEASCREKSNVEAPAGLLLPPGCETIAAAAKALATEVDDVRELDKRVQQRLLETSGGLARACLTSADLPRTFVPVLIELAEALLEPRLGAGGAADLFLKRHAGEETAKALSAAWAAAAPAWPTESGEVTTTIAPAQFTELIRDTLGPKVPTITSDEEITVVRSVPRLPLTSLPQFGPTAKAAYQRRKSAAESPHARMDVPFGE